VARQVLLMMNLRLDDVVRLRKRHPCGGDEWRVVRLGADIGAICTTCGRRVMMPRSKFEKQVKQILDRGGEFKRPD
jgi:hypothetical protein